MAFAEPRSSVRLIAGVVLALSLSTLLAGEAVLNAAHPGVCSFRQRTGLPCLGCGGTHALARMARGDVAGAVAANPLGAWAGSAAWLLALGAAVSAATGRRTFLAAALLAVLVLSPAAFVWNAVSWWTSLPAGALMVP